MGVFEKKSTTLIKISAGNSIKKIKFLSISERMVITKLSGRKSVKIGEITMFDTKKINEKIGK